MPNSRRTARTLAVAFVVSLALHLALVPFLRSIPPARAEKPQRPQIISLEEPRARPTPKPTTPPTPKPTMLPTLKPERTPRVVQTSAPTSSSKRAAFVAPRRSAIRAPRAVAVMPPGLPGPGTSGAGPANDGVGPGNGGAGTVPGTSGVDPGPVALPPTEAPPPTAPEKPNCAKPQVAARVIDTIEPRVPEIAREQHAVGVANVRVDLDDRGSVLGVTVAKSAGSAALDAAALDAARRSTYAAAIVDCRPEGGSYLFRVEFEDG